MTPRGCTFVRAAVFATVLFAVFGIGLASGQVLEHQRFESEALGESLAYTVYLPPGYDTQARSYPVIYMLHGYGGQDTDWVRYAKIDQIADRLIADGTLPPAIIVMPDGKNSWYVASEAWGDYETAIAHDLVAHVDATYSTIAERSSRVIGGLSMGGYGAAFLAFKHMDTFAAAGVMSGALYAETMPPWPELVGEPADEERWAELDVFNLIDQVAASEERCGWPPPSTICMHVYVNAGDRDELGFHRDSVLFYDALVEAEIPAELRILSGHHSWGFWEATVPDVLAYFAYVFQRYY